MTRCLLDTDQFSLFLNGHPDVVARVLSTPADEVAIGVITVSELVQGWQAQINRHSLAGGAPLWRAYSRLAQLPVELAAVTILAYGAEEETRFLAWRQGGLRTGTNGLRIAAVAATAGAVVVTRNRRDFGRVPGIECEDWSAAGAP